jgi:hypothetical protein
MRNPCLRQTLLTAAALLCAAIAAPLAVACTIPVFRYALERWESDRLVLVVYFDGSLSAEDDAALKHAAEQSSLVGGPLNIEVLRYNVAEPLTGAWAELKPPADRPLPWAELRARVRSGTAVCWQGPLSQVTTAENFFDSPARRELVERTLKGDSCVWLLVAPADQLAQQADKLQHMLDSSTKELSIPAGVGQPGSELYAPVPLQVRFSVLPIAHDNPAEEVLLTMVSAAAPKWNKDAAYVVPVFGRCRALEVIPLAEVDDFVAQDVGGFLCAACSCRVKQANPGFDLLVSAPWNDRLFGQSLPPHDALDPPPVPPVVPTESATEPVYLTIPAGTNALQPVPAPAAASSSASGVGSGKSSLFIGTVLGLVVGMFLGLIWYRK